MTRAPRLLLACTALALSAVAIAAAPARKPPAAGANNRSAAATAEKKAAAAATFEVYQDKAGEYRWRLRARNSQVIAISPDGYKEKRAVLSAIESVRKDVADAPVEEPPAGSGGATEGKSGAASGSGARK